MKIRSLYDAVLRNIEDGGGAPAPASPDNVPVDTGPRNDAPVDTGSNDDAPRDEPPPLRDQLSQIWDQQNTPRNERGQFQSRNPAPKGEGEPNSDDVDGPNAATGDDGGKTTSPQDDEDGTGPNAATEDAMPKSWSKEDEQVWAAMPPEARARVHAREQQIAQVITRAGNAVKAFRENDPVHRGTEAFREYFKGREQATGIPTDRFVHDVLRVAHSFDSAKSNDDKLAIVGQILEQFDVDISPWIGPDAAEALKSGSQSDSRVEALERQVRELTEGRNREALAEMDRSLTHAIDTFSKDTENFPHFALVRNDMGEYLATVGQNDDRPIPALLKDAYEFACLRNPTVRSRVLRAEAEKLAKEQNEQIDTKATAARRASATNVRSGVPSPSKQSISDTVRSVADKLYR